jgi:uncharacterized damage-inducible protein DinB
LVTTIPQWVAMTINEDSLNVNPPESAHRPPVLKTTAELLETLDQAIESGRQALRHTTDDHLMTSWRMLANGRLVSEQPRYLVLRHGVFNHLAHHRGQLTVYLRLNDAMVPAIYGPSADDRRFD